jgi:TetR/AcrR family transcriptional repressor of nem operon
MIVIYHVKTQIRPHGACQGTPAAEGGGNVKVTREQATQNRERIIATAARLFRERGFEGIGVADLMNEAGLTHGGFYGHFESKEDLMARACEKAFEESRARWRSRVENARGKPLAALAKGYLSAKHRDNPGAGCIIAALGPDASRHGAGVRRPITGWLRSAFAELAELVHGRGPAARRRRAIAIYASWLGAMVLARAVDDRALSDEILDSVFAETMSADAASRR